LTHPENTKTRRLFLALWPDDTVRNQIFELQQKIAGNNVSRSAENMSRHKPRRVARQNLHITLHFIGSVTEEKTGAFVQSLDGIQCPAFNLIIDCSGYFKQARTFWLGANNVPEQLDTLVKKTAKCVERSFEDYHAKKFVPHITLFRKANREMVVEDFEPITWRVNNFVLVESKTYPEGVEYAILKEWGLKQ
jgi:2'-5' RNA ligase